jgi:hypothetical protein
MVFLGILLLFLGCTAMVGEEIGRLKINELSPENQLVIKEVALDLKKGDEIGIWSDIDIEYEDDIILRFRIGVDKDGEEHGRFEIDPTEKSITTGELKRTIMRKTNWKFMGKNSKIKIEEDGKYTFKGLLVASDNPSLKITKAEIVLKK